MKKEQAIKAILFSIVILAAITAVYAANDQQDKNCVAKPMTGISVASITQGVSFIMAGGTGPILILVIAFIVGMIVSHVIWGGF